MTDTDKNSIPPGIPPVPVQDSRKVGFGKAQKATIAAIAALVLAVGGLGFKFLYPGTPAMSPIITANTPESDEELSAASQDSKEPAIETEPTTVTNMTPSQILLSDDWKWKKPI